MEANESKTLDVRNYTSRGSILEQTHKDGLASVNQTVIIVNPNQELNLINIDV